MTSNGKKRNYELKLLCLITRGLLFALFECKRFFSVKKARDY